ncbi:DUF3574 domain-containing protein [Streptomyces purpureus]|uniref:DUF3574 domain-containing protein n=1 Tax=Streptomyces purpureus TaxID=1951 RepID=A0A918LVW5_9ACTN|nr:DUF3574 domain-containing protein [Streptomyces purpureus]GGT60018.1 hypothetical protein GCM10014713_61870 [Streptomyces purpureus]
MRHIRVSTSAAAIFIAALLLLASGGPVTGAAVPAAPAPAAAEQNVTGRMSPYVSTHLYFGTGRHDGKPPITDAEFMRFVNDVITPRFPSGLTLQEGRGQWRDKDGDINSERSYELTLLYPARHAPALNDDIEYIRRAYCALYDLESVGRADVRAQVDF